MAKKSFAVLLYAHSGQSMHAQDGEDWKTSTACRIRRERFSRDGYVVPEARLEEGAMNGLWSMVISQLQMEPGRTNLSPEDLIADGRGELFGAIYEDDVLVSPASKPHTFSTMAQPKDSAEILKLSTLAVSQLFPVVYSPALRHAVSCVLPDVSRWRLMTYMKLTAKFREDRPNETDKWHQDAFLYNGIMGGIWDEELMNDLNEHAVTAFIAVSPIARNMGGLEYQPGVQHLGFAGTHATERHLGPPEYSVAFHTNLPFASGPASHAVAMELGEFTLHSLYTPHATTPNTSPYARWGLEIRFVDADWAESVWLNSASMDNYVETITLGWPLGEPIHEMNDYDSQFLQFFENVSSLLGFHDLPT